MTSTPAPTATPSEEEEERVEDPPEPAAPRPRKEKRKSVKPKQEPDAETESSVAPTEDIRDMLRAKAAAGDGAKPAIHQEKLETFSGSRSHYRDWKRVLQAQKSLYRLDERDLAMLVYLSCRGEARQILNQLEMSEIEAEGGYNRVMALLEEAYGSRADERFEERQDAYLQH